MAAGKSMANEVIERLPQDYEQMLGRRFENGVDLSGGEWQKVALARAYLRDAQLLDSRRAHRRARCPQRVRSISAFRRADDWEDGTVYFASFFNRADGRPHRRACSTDRLPKMEITNS